MVLDVEVVGSIEAPLVHDDGAAWHPYDSLTSLLARKAAVEKIFPASDVALRAYQITCPRHSVTSLECIDIGLDLYRANTAIR